MIVLYVFIGLVMLAYALGCLVAYGMVTSEEAEFCDFTSWEIFSYTLGSWGTVFFSVLGRI